MNSEIGDRKWFWSGVALQMGTGYTVAFLVYQVGTFLMEGTVGTGFLPGLIVVGGIAGVVAYLCKEADQKAAAMKK
jgi:ferrous iron transport protein B